MGTPREAVPVLARPGVPHGEALIKCGHFFSRDIAREVGYPESVIFKLAFSL